MHDEKGANAKASADPGSRSAKQDTRHLRRYQSTADRLGNEHGMLRAFAFICQTGYTGTLRLCDPCNESACSHTF